MFTSSTHTAWRARALAVSAFPVFAILAAIAPLHLGAQAAPPATMPVSFFGEIRARSEWDRPGGPLAADVYTYLRTRLGIRANPAEGVRIVFQLQDSRVYGVNINTAANNPDIFDLHQGYVDLSTTWKNADVTARVGRQEISFGNERLVGPVAWSNVGRTMDGARMLWSPRGAVAGKEPWTATAFIATVDERGRHFATSTMPAGASYPADRLVIGAYMTRALNIGAFDGTLLYDAGAKYRTFSSSDRFTADARLRAGLAKPIGIEIEGAYQGGRQIYQASAASARISQDVAAWLVGARAGRFAAAGRKVSAIIGVDMLSGDAKAPDGTYTAFNTMYATNHPFYGLMDLFLDPAARTNDQGLVDALGIATMEVNSRASVRTELHHYAPQAGKTSEIGWEFNAIVPLKLSNSASLDLGYGLFRAGPGASAMGLGAKDYARHWAYAQLRAWF